MEPASAQAIGTGIGLATTGTSTITSTGTSLALNGTVDNASSGTVTFVGNFEVGNCSTVDAAAIYVEGETSGNVNGFKQAQKTVSIIDEGTANGEGATLTYNGTSIGKMNGQGKVTFDAGTDYTKFYVNTGSEKVSTAQKHEPSPALASIELADDTTLVVDQNIDVSKVNVTGGSAKLSINAGQKVTSNGATKALTLTGAGEYEITGADAPGVTVGTLWTGTVTFIGSTMQGLNDAWGKAGSKVALQGTDGSLNGTSSLNLELRAGTGGWGFGQTATGSQVVTLNGAITGEGNLGVKSGTATSTFILGGDISGWNGNFVDNSGDGGSTTLQLAGSDKTVNGSVLGTHLTVDVQANSEFKKSVNAKELKVTSGMTAKLDETFPPRP